MKKLMAVLGAALAAGLSFAETYTWTGEGDDPHEWTDPKNWKKSNGKNPTTNYNPGYGDNEIAIFDPGEGNTLYITNSLAWWPTVTRLHEIRVLSGTVFISKGYFHFDDPLASAASVTSRVTVAKGATLDVWAQVAAKNSLSPLIKDGEGDWIQRRFFGRSSASGVAFGTFDVLAGSFYRAYGQNTGWDADSRMTKINSLIVRSGASFGWQNYSMMVGLDDAAKTYTDIHVEKGGTIHLGQDGSSTIDGLSGEGDVVLDSGSHPLHMTLKKRDYVFGGSFRGTGLYCTTKDAIGTHVFTIASASALAEVGLSGFVPVPDNVRFAPGIGEFTIRYLDGSRLYGKPLLLEDTDGEPITLFAGFGDGTWVGRLLVSGSGSFMQRNEYTTYANGLTNGQVAITGEIGSTESGNLVLGRKAEGTDPDLSRLAAVRGDGKLVFNPFSELVIPCPVYSKSLMSVYGDTVINELHKTANSIYTYDGASLSILGGESVQGVFDLYGGPLFLSNCSIGGVDSVWMNEYDSWHVRSRPMGVNVNYKSADAVMAVSNAFVRIGNSNGEPALGSFSAKDSTVELVRSFNGTSYASAFAIRLDNSTLRFNYSRTPYTMTFPSGLDTSSGTVSKNWAIKVGARGARFESVRDAAFGMSANHTLEFGMPVEPDDGVDQDGGITLNMPNHISFFRPIKLTGPVAFEHFRAIPQSCAYADGEDVFGTGDFTLRNAWLHLRGYEGRTSARIAANGTFRFEGAGRITPNGSGNPSMDVTLGRTGAETSTLTRGEAGVLFIGDSDLAAYGFDGTLGRVFVKGGVEKFANGRVKLPVFSGLSVGTSGSPYRAGFLTYDDTNGFTDFTGYTEGLDGGADSVAKIDFETVGKVTVAAGETKEVSALYVRNGSEAKYLDVQGALKVGNGTDAACVLLNNAGSGGFVRLFGAGTLDFGDSEGVITVSRGAGAGANPAIVSAKVAGTKGVTLAGIFGLTHVWLRWNGDNAYSGGTFITGVSVLPGSDTAFGTGPVKVLGGDTSGAQVSFTTPITLANPLVVSGTGMNFFGNYSGDINGGALWFHADTTIAGPVEVVRRARFSTKPCPNYPLLAPSGTGVFTGVISGAAVQIGPQGKAPIVFAAANTYTGGTEIVSSTLTLRGPCSVGTGVVTLDGGTLRFENTEPITFTNDFEGVGTIVCAGTAPVTFTGKGLEKVPAILKTLQPGWSFDTPSGDNCTVAVGADGLDLGGASLAVGILGGSGRVENGVLTVTGEIRPGGEDAVGTLTFAPGVLVADGATFVCEVGPDGMDKVVIENAFDLSGLSLRTVKIGSFNGKAPILSATELTGEFATTEFAKRSHEISYGDTAVTLSVGKGMMLIVR